jgi:hypothetical protein
VTETDQPPPPDPHIAWSGYCLIGDHLLCEQPDECGCTECHHHPVDDDHNQRQEQP